MTEKFEDYFNHEDTAVQDAAKLLAQCESQKNVGALTQDEFDELAQDMLEIEAVYGLADDLDRKVKVEKAFNALKMIAGFVL